MFSSYKSKALRLSTIGITLAALTFSAISASAATLSTGLTANNGHRGVMFNVSTGADALLLESIQADFYASTTADYEVYYTIGDYAAVQNTPTAWKLHDSISGLTGVAGEQTWDIVDLFLPKNKTIGLYITNTVGGGVNYANGSSLGQQLATDGTLSIFGGVGRAYAFGNTYTPRNFVGGLTYSIAPVPLPAALPLLLVSVGGLSIAARRRRT